MANITDSITNINFLSQEQFNSIVAPSNNELYAVEFTPKGFNLFDYKLSNYTLNDPRWLSANAFTWQYCEYVDENYQGYEAAYKHLVADLGIVQNLYCWIGEKMGDVYYTYSENPVVGDTTTDGDSITRIDSYGRPVVGPEYLDRYPDGDILSTQTDIIGDTTIEYYLADDGHKICLPDQETALQTIYDAIGAADYFILDQENKRFKLPRKQKRQLIQSWSNGFSWYKLYSDGWVEQGGSATTSTDKYVTVTLHKSMKNTNYTVNVAAGWSNAASGQNEGFQNRTTTSINITTSYASTFCMWEVKGYAASVPTQTQLEYYYVGEYTIPALENTAGINTETLNNKVDRDFGNIPTGYDIVIDWQAPTEANNYTWYRKYKSGWIEQGGYGISGYSGAVTLPVEMVDTSYHIVFGGSGKSTNNNTIVVAGYNKTTTGFTIQSNVLNSSGASSAIGSSDCSWQVSGMAA